MALQGLAMYRLDGISFLSAPGTLFTIITAGEGIPGQRFLPQNCYMVPRTMTGGALNTAPSMRVGSNVNHDNVAPVFTPATSITVGRILTIPLASPLSAPPINSSSVIFEITASAVGPTTMTGDVLLVGLMVS